MDTNLAKVWFSYPWKLKATSLQIDGFRFLPLLCLPNFLIYFQGRKKYSLIVLQCDKQKSIWFDWAVLFQMAKVPLEVMVAVPAHFTRRFCFFLHRKASFCFYTADMSFLFFTSANLEFSENMWCVQGHHAYWLPGWGIAGNEAVRLLPYSKRSVNFLWVIYVTEFWSIKVNQINFEDIYFSFNMDTKIRHR